MGSVTMRNATAAEAAADKLRKERRDFEGTLSVAITHLIRDILPQNGPEIATPRAHHKTHGLLC
jgi:hypothetical protein